MSLLFTCVLWLLYAFVGVLIPAVLGAVIALNWTRQDRIRQRQRARRLEAERDGALQALAVIGQVRTNPPRTAALAPLPPGALATSPVRILRPPLTAVPGPSRAGDR